MPPASGPAPSMTAPWKLPPYWAGSDIVASDWIGRSTCLRSLDATPPWVV